jgi:hypothetical protein
MEKAAVGASADLIDDVGLKISVDGTWNIFSLAWIQHACQKTEIAKNIACLLQMRTSLGEESAESVVRVFLLAFFGQVSIGLNSRSANKTYSQTMTMGKSRAAQGIGSPSRPRLHVPGCRAQGSKAKRPEKSARSIFPHIRRQRIFFFLPLSSKISKT